ncbi:MFS transporter [Sinomonas atrocyanea]
MNTSAGDTISPEATMGRRNPRRAAISGWIGSALEYYDFALYSTVAALVFPGIFFPSGNPTVAIIASLATYAVGYVSRPLGAVVLGAYGDRHGRKKVLVFAMLLMGTATFAVGLLPTYRQVGLLAPALLVALRLIQGFAVAGELGGASAMIVEHSPDAKRGFFASFSLQGTQVGSILATAALLPLSAMLPADQFQSWGWRVPFLLSAFVILAGYLIRRRVQEPPAYVAQSAQAAVKRRFPLLELLRSYPWVLVRCILMTFTNVIGMATLVFGVSYATQKGYGIGFSAGEFLWVTLVANIVAVILIPVFGALSDRIGRRALMVVGGVGGGLLATAYLWAIDQRSLVLVFVFVVIVQGRSSRCGTPPSRPFSRSSSPADPRDRLRGGAEHRPHDRLVLPQHLHRDRSPWDRERPPRHRRCHLRHLRRRRPGGAPLPGHEGQVPRGPRGREGLAAPEKHQRRLGPLPGGGSPRSPAESHPISTYTTSSGEADDREDQGPERSGVAREAQSAAAGTAAVHHAQRPSGADPPAHREPGRHHG